MAKKISEFFMRLVDINLLPSGKFEMMFGAG